MALNLFSLMIHVIVNVIIISPSLWISGRLLVGKARARFSDAVWIVVLGTIIGAFVGVFFTGLVASLVQLVLWLLLVKHFFETGWLTALVISIIAVIIFIVIAIALGLIGMALITFL